MRLDRNTRPDGEGKYGVLNLRKVREVLNDKNFAPGFREKIDGAIDLLIQYGLLSVEGPRDAVGISGTADAFFVLKAGDTFATSALYAYAVDARESAETLSRSPNRAKEAESLLEMSEDIRKLAADWSRIPGRKIPD